MNEIKIDLYRFLGKWFEIAKIPIGFELNLTNVTAEYQYNSDKTIQIINRGYLNGDMKEIIGTAYTTDVDDLLKVSFFPNIYSDYKILSVDKDYKYAVIGGQNKDFLWILARTKTISSEIYSSLIDIAKRRGYNTDKLIITC